jgi:biopolymer transport protein ExbD
VLVLLIIFMVTSPLTMNQIPVEVPPAPPEGAVPGAPNIEVTLRADGRVDIRAGAASELVALLDVPNRLRALRTGTLAGAAVFVSVHTESPYGNAVAVMDAIRAAGVERINLAR